MPKLTNDKKIGLTSAELEYLKSFLNAGDRPGFYYAYYSIVSEDTSYFQVASDVGKDEASLQAKISSFSEPVGAAAYYSNRILQEHLGAGYEGIYNLSQKVASAAYNAILKSVGDGGTGLISDKEFFISARQAWGYGDSCNNP
ncbi:MAG: hypothetical protein ACKVOJ_14025 [Sphingomonadaceae bacterium]